MLRRLGKTPAANKIGDISKAYRQQERHVRSWCTTRGIHAMSVSFQTLVHRPDQILPQLAGFLGVPDKLPAMRACIDPALHRARQTGPPLRVPD
jgi:LPS sulfotransferase NodH